METVLAVGVILAIVCMAGGYVYKAKKRGQKCIGCPGNCSECQIHKRKEEEA